jgi:hypothetical protein
LTVVEDALDLTGAEWVRQSITTFAKDVSSIVPDRFEAYARILHPLEGGARWAEVAKATGRVLHPEVQFQGIATPVGELIPRAQWEVRGPWRCPSTGTMPAAVRERLAAVLAPFTSTPNRIWYALWTGYGYLHPPRGSVRVLSRSGEVVNKFTHPDPHPEPERFEVRPGRPTLELPHRSYIVYTGSLADLATWSWEGPNLWWPEDRACFVATEIDFVSTYVGGSDEAIHAILTEPELEALPSRITDSINRDEINA